jgi:hypothetical protein
MTLALDMITCVMDRRRNISFCDATSWVSPDRCIGSEMAFMRCALETAGLCFFSPLASRDDE